METTLKKYNEYAERYILCENARNNNLPCCGHPSTCMYACDVMLDYREEDENGYLKDYNTICTMHRKEK